MRSSSVSLGDIQSMIGAYKARASALRHRLGQIDADMASVEATLASMAGSGTSSVVKRGPGRPRKVAAAATAAPAAAPAASASAPKRARRGRRAGGRRAAGQDLASIIAKVLAASKPLGIPGIVAAVKKSGYESSSPSFARIVGMRLGDRKRFKRVGRGVYTVVKK